MNKYQFIINQALHLQGQGMTWTGQTLAQELNRQGFRTSYGSVYQGGRGVYRAIKCAWDYALRNGGQGPAHAVATAFTDSRGGYAYW